MTNALSLLLESVVTPTKPLFASLQGYYGADGDTGTDNEED